MVAAADIQALLVEGFFSHREQEQAARTAERGTADKQNPYITDLGKECERALWKGFRNHPAEEIDLAGLLTFEMGHAVEDRVARFLEAHKVEVVREVRVEIPVAGTVVTGRIDFLLLADGALIELKSIGAQQLDMMLRKGQQGRPENAAQLNGYLHASHLGAVTYDVYEPGHTAESARRTLPPQDKGFLVYINAKPDWKAELSYATPVVVFEVPYNEVKAHGDLARLAYIWSLEQEPPIPQGYSRYGFPCGSKRRDGSTKSWCAYYDSCWPQGKARNPWTSAPPATSSTPSATASVRSANSTSSPGSFSRPSAQAQTTSPPQPSTS